MRTLGIRVSPKCVFYCVSEEKLSNIEVLNVDKITVPLKMETQYQLGHVKTNIISILKEYDIKKVGIRATENNAMKISIPRLYMEGVIIETLGNSAIESFYIGTIVKIASLLKEDSKLIKKYIDNKLIFRDIDGWDKYSPEHRESIISAIAAQYL